jgi:hypothetical protein
MGLLQLQILLEQEFLVVRQLNHERNVKCLLQPSGKLSNQNTPREYILAENKRDHVADVHAAGTGSSAGIQIKRLSFFIAVENLVQFSANQSEIPDNAILLPVRKEESSSEEMMRLSASQLLKSLNQGIVDTPRAKVRDERIVINALELAINLCALDIPGRDDLLVGSVGFCHSKISVTSCSQIQL